MHAIALFLILTVVFLPEVIEFAAIGIFAVVAWFLGLGLLYVLFALSAWPASWIWHSMIYLFGPGFADDCATVLVMAGLVFLFAWCYDSCTEWRGTKFVWNMAVARFKQIVRFFKNKSKSWTIENIHYSCKNCHTKWSEK